MFICLDMIPVCDGRTDRRTDTQPVAKKRCIAMAWRASKTAIFIVLFLFLCNKLTMMMMMMMMMMKTVTGFAIT